LGERVCRIRSVSYLSDLNTLRKALLNIGVSQFSTKEQADEARKGILSDIKELDRRFENLEI